MITFTKEQLIASAHARIEFAEMMLAGELEPLKERTWSIELELARIALASLEAEVVAYIRSAHNPDGFCFADGIHPTHRHQRLPLSTLQDGCYWKVTPLYTAPPAPAKSEPVAWLWSHRKHPSEVTLVRPEDDERAEGANWSGWSCQALYAAPPAQVSVPDALPESDDEEGNDIDYMEPSEVYAFGRAAGWNACRAAMLQGADNELQRKAAIHDALCEKYSVESLADFVDWQRNHITELEAAPPAPVGPNETAVMPDYPGYVMTQRECFKAGAKRAVPDGWVVVPVEPTSEMQSAAAGAIRFDTTPINKLWTGNAVYKAMIAAAPQQEVKP
ncbi:hypothetical protein [Enterobacter roggenkampii]|uniref:hypothetical protein n=1 Tax=Enterobacter roggenkampii TaxID=1812935 RepID=UPI002006BB28|nr:hypothetical protein [Enterobacter roggenkampii]MCK6943192.1 hypothetical protein [Enterobacter roggenkampii]